MVSQGICMKQILVLSCLFSVGLFADVWDSRYGEAPSKQNTPLWRAREQFNECIAARGEINRAECQDEYESLVACIYREQNERNDFNQQRNDAVRKYNQARQRIETQYCQCLQARGSNRQQECLSERDSLIANAMAERDVVLVNEFDEAQYERNIANLLGKTCSCQRQQEQADRNAKIMAAVEVVAVGSIAASVLYYVFRRN